MAIQTIGTNPIQVMSHQKLSEVNKTLNKENNVNFGEMLLNAMDSVNEAQKTSEILGDKFMIGEIDNIHDVKIAGLKADLSLTLATEVTNKLLAAYNEIMRLQL